jgi:anti-sigma factor RsiW
MTACKDIQEIISAYLDGAVSPDQKRLVAEHLASCPECSALREDLGKTVELVKGLEEVEPPPWLAQKIMAHVKDEAEKEVGVFRRLFYPLRIKIPLQAFATLLIVGLVFYVYKGTVPELQQAKAPSGAEEVLPQKAPRAHFAESPPAPAPGNRPPAGQARDESAPASVAPAPSGAGIEGSRQGAEKPLLLRSAEKTEAEAGAGIAVKAKEAPKAGAPAALSAPRSVAKAAEPVDVTLRVVDMKSAAAEVEELLRQAGSRNVARESREGSEFLAAELQREKARTLVEKLDDIGDVEPSRPELPAGFIAMKIKIVPNN